MAKSMRFWGQASAMIEVSDMGGVEFTKIGRQVLTEEGYEPYLGDEQTLWLVHWMLSKSLASFHIWPVLVNEWQEPDFTVTSAVNTLERFYKENNFKVTAASIKSMLAVFVNTYLKVHKRKNTVVEDILDSPLATLGYLRHVGERPLYCSERVSVTRSTPIKSDLFTTGCFTLRQS